jgi:hypothetical protein
MVVGCAVKAGAGEVVINAVAEAIEQPVFAAPWLTTQ